ncbi:hypothetical protein [Streptomyces anthocyanicus]|uniref:hypothetical protein n=1 Tax=Streptomyces anthocyanicus TaxID=68174 RepID=UPI0037B4E6D9
MTKADNPENTVPTSAFALSTLNDHRRALTVTTDYGTDPNDLQSRAAKDVRPLLEAHGIHIPASTARFRTPTDIATFLDLDKNKIKPTC